jgi:hypothetical protein
MRDPRRIRLLHLVGALTQPEYTCEDFERDTAHLPGVSLEFQLAFQDGDIDLGPPVRLTMQGKTKLKHEVMR